MNKSYENLKSNMLAKIIAECLCEKEEDKENENR